jgi:cytochrome b subunit of formate dehydrogenase
MASDTAKHGPVPWLAIASILLLSATFGVGRARSEGPEDAGCEGCHEIETTHSTRPAGRGGSVPHRAVRCIDCHSDLKTFDPDSAEDHDTPLAAATCSDCHAEIEQELADSEHAGECSQCHEAHGIGLRRETNGEQRSSRAGVCAECHESSVEEWLLGVHETGSDTEPPAASCVDCHGSHAIAGARTRGSRVHPLSIPDTCEACHRENGAAAASGLTGDKAQDYETSVHGLALRRDGLIVTATCVSCHGFHDIRRSNDPLAPSSRKRLPETCGSCHVGILDGYLEGVHGAAFSRGIDDVPVCNDCHREHAVQDPSVAGTSASAALVAETCARCHADDALVNRYDLKATAWASWGRSYHGIASGYGEARSANCASCHGHHEIFPASDTRSSIHESNLEKTCGQCHAGAGAAFVRIPVHSILDRETNFVPWLVRQVYAVFVAALIAAFIVLVVVDLIGRLRLRAGWGPSETEHVDATQWHDEDSLVSPAETFERMGRHARLQHGVLILAFLLLVITGLPVFLHDSEVLQSFLSIEGGYRLRSKMHRIGAVVLVGLSVWHLAILAMVPSARRWFALMMISMQDVRDFVADLGFSLGILRRRPALGRYGLVEKLEYGSVLWGNVVMIVTGTVLWRPSWFLTWVPIWTFDVCRIIHGFEATLAFLAIIIWHMYHVHVKPGVFPMNRTWITGRITREELKRDHPREYLRLLEQRRHRGRESTEARSD